MAVITRKQFLKQMWGLIFLPYLVFLVLMTKKHRRVVKAKEVRLSGNLPEGVSFFEDIICVKSNNDLSVFSSRCTHLGCQIDKSEKGMLVCPCHGSTFDMEGGVVKGPARSGLEVLAYEIDAEKNEFIIRLNH